MRNCMAFCPSLKRNREYTSARSTFGSRAYPVSPECGSYRRAGHTLSKVGRRRARRSLCAKGSAVSRLYKNRRRSGEAADLVSALERTVAGGVPDRTPHGARRTARVIAFREPPYERTGGAPPEL